MFGKGKTASGQATPWEALGPPELEALLGPGSRHPGQSQAGFPLVAPTGLGPETMLMLQHLGCESTQHNRTPRAPQMPRTSGDHMWAKPLY